MGGSPTQDGPGYATGHTVLSVILGLSLRLRPSMTLRMIISHIIPTLRLITITLWQPVSFLCSKQSYTHEQILSPIYTCFSIGIFDRKEKKFTFEEKQNNFTTYNSEVIKMNPTSKQP